MSLFLNSEGSLRSGWRCGAYIAIWLSLWIVMGLLVAGVLAVVYPSILLLPTDDIRFLGLNFAISFGPAFTALLLMARFVEHTPIAVFGVAFHRRWLRDFSVGLAVAGGMLIVLVAGAALFGTVSMRWSAGSGMIGALAGTVAVLLIAAANEELVFRGYPFQVLIQGIGPWPAMLLVSAIFGLVHAGNPNATSLGVLNTILAGIMLSLAYMKTRSLWFPYGIHIGWNAGLGVVLGLPLSGIDTASLWTTEVDAPPLILGGGYGPEAGLLGTFIFLAAAVTIKVMRTTERVYVSD